MKENRLKKEKVLYIIIVGLLVLMIGMFCYFQMRLNNLQEHTEANTNVSLAIFKRLNSVVELNYLDTDIYKYLIDPSNWEETLKSETALSLSDLENYKIDKVIVRQHTDMSPDDLSEYIIYIDMLNDASFKDFTDFMYKKISDIFIITNNDTSKVESFKEGRGYYDIESFEEATYNNMYYDYMKEMSDGSTGGPKVKVKILYLEETNQIKMEVNKF